MVSLVFQQQESVESELIENVFTGSNSSHIHGHGKDTIYYMQGMIC